MLLFIEGTCPPAGPQSARVSLWSAQTQNHLHISCTTRHTWALANYIIGLAAACDWIPLTNFLHSQRAADSTLQNIQPCSASRLKGCGANLTEDYGSLQAGSRSALQTNSLMRSDLSECRLRLENTNRMTPLTRKTKVKVKDPESWTLRGFF